MRTVAVPVRIDDVCVVRYEGLVAGDTGTGVGLVASGPGGTISTAIGCRCGRKCVLGTRGHLAGDERCDEEPCARTKHRDYGSYAGSH
jgi:hypothetical protein